jgi:DNA-binding transcriptional regulator YbjK
MNTDLPTLKVRGRSASQDRSQETKQKIVRAAIEVIAEFGLARLTHRLVAERAGVGLASTTYYYEAKDDIIADVSNMLLGNYVLSFERVADQIKSGMRPASSFRDLVVRLLVNAAGKKRAETAAWMELLLDAARHPENQQFGRQWAERLEGLWADIARLHNMPEPRQTTRSAIDLVIGLQLAILALGLDEQQVHAVLSGNDDPLQLWRQAETVSERPDAKPQGGTTSKARTTRNRIIEATMGIVVDEGVGAVSYRLVSQRAGLTAAAPAYYFSTPAELLRAAQGRLFENSKDRYRSAMSGVDQGALDPDLLVDLTAAVFLREATEYGDQGLASYGIWLEAARQPELRPKIWSAIEDQGKAWNRVFASLAAAPRPLDALVAQFLFIGKLVRITCLGAVTPDLAQVRREFHCDLNALIAHRHWLTKNST